MAKSHVLCTFLMIINLFYVQVFAQTEKSNHKKYPQEKFCMGVDLSYVNHIQDKGGIYKEKGVVADPFEIFADHGANTVRVRLWHTPIWNKEVYGDEGKQMYSDLADVIKTIKRAKDAGMSVNLDIHYSDFWADPQHQNPPKAWAKITDLNVLKDSVYNYTYNVLNHLKNLNLMPEMVQVGNETNCGMMINNTDSLFPNLNACKGGTVNLGSILNEGIRAVRDVAELTDIKPKIILHIADPKNLEWWFENITTKGSVTDFDIIGFSYYPLLWHKDIAFNDVPSLVSKLIEKYNKEVMIVETAYPWTPKDNDSYGNIFGNQEAMEGFPYTVDGQKDFLITLTQNMINAGATGIMIWEPAWITSGMTDPWGNGSCWENNTFFDFEGNVLNSIDFMIYPYNFPEEK